MDFGGPEGCWSQHPGLVDQRRPPHRWKTTHRLRQSHILVTDGVHLQPSAPAPVPGPATCTPGRPVFLLCSSVKLVRGLRNRKWKSVAECASPTRCLLFRRPPMGCLRPLTVYILAVARARGDRSGRPLSRSSWSSPAFLGGSSAAGLRPLCWSAHFSFSVRRLLRNISFFRPWLQKKSRLTQDPGNFLL